MHCAPGWWEAEEGAGGRKGPCTGWPRASILPAGGQENVSLVVFLELSYYFNDRWFVSMSFEMKQ